jgi:hypothetical protein
LAAGVLGSYAKPLKSLAVFQETILSLMPKDYSALSAVRMVSGDIVEPDLIEFKDDMAHAAEVLKKDDVSKQIDYLVLFLRGVARSAADAALLEATEKLDTAHKKQQQPASYLAQLDDLIQARLAQRLAV